MNEVSKKDKKPEVAAKTVAAIGWTTVILVTLASGFWAFWGVQEAFHEGWCKATLAMRLLQVVTYLSPTIVMMTLTVISLRWPRVGAGFFVGLATAIGLLILADGAKFGWQVTSLLTAVPLLIGFMFLIGRPKPKRAAYWVSTVIPVLVILIFGAGPVWRVSTRFDDGDRGSRLVEGNGVTLLWAPAGPGWTRNGLASWQDAISIASRLNADGTSLSDEPQDIWRLPTREEVVRSLTRDNANAGGTWVFESEQANYSRRPDKESPLWDSHAPLIYLWTSEEVDNDQAWIVVYHGGVFAKPKQVGSPSHGFRAVRDPIDSTLREPGGYSDPKE